MTTEKQKAQDFNFQTAHIGSYADIMEARAFAKKGQKVGEPKFACTFVIPADNSDLKKLKAEVTAMLSAKAPGKKFVTRRMTQEELDAGNVAEVQVPWKDGTKFADAEKAKGKDAEYARGHVLVKTSSKYQPALSALDGGKLIEFATPESIAQAKKFFYSGAFMVPSVGLHWYKGDGEGENKKPDGVSLFLNAVMFAKHGPRLGGRQANASEMFKAYIGSISQEDPTAGDENLDDEIPF